MDGKGEGAKKRSDRGRGRGSEGGRDRGRELGHAVLGGCCNSKERRRFAVPREHTTPASCPSPAFPFSSVCFRLQAAFSHRSGEGTSSRPSPGPPRAPPCRPRCRCWTSGHNAAPADNHPRQNACGQFCARARSRAHHRTICQICIMLSSATEQMTMASFGFQEKSDTLLVCPPWMNCARSRETRHEL